jgi:hypothetical protein
MKPVCASYALLNRRCTTRDQPPIAACHCHRLEPVSPGSRRQRQVQGVECATFEPNPSGKLFISIQDNVFHKKPDPAIAFPVRRGLRQYVGVHTHSRHRLESVVAIDAHRVRDHASVTRKTISTHSFADMSWTESLAWSCRIGSDAFAKSVRP